MSSGSDRPPEQLMSYMHIAHRVLQILNHSFYILKNRQIEGHVLMSTIDVMENEIRHERYNYSCGNHAVVRDEASGRFRLDAHEHCFHLQPGNSVGDQRDRSRWDDPRKTMTELELEFEHYQRVRLEKIPGAAEKRNISGILTPSANADRGRSPSQHSEMSAPSAQGKPRGGRVFLNLDEQSVTGFKPTSDRLNREILRHLIAIEDEVEDNAVSRNHGDALGTDYLRCKTIFILANFSHRVFVDALPKLQTLPLEYVEEYSKGLDGCCKQLNLLKSKWFDYCYKFGHNDAKFRRYLMQMERIYSLYRSMMDTEIWLSSASDEEDEDDDDDADDEREDRKLVGRQRVRGREQKRERGRDRDEDQEQKKPSTPRIVIVPATPDNESQPVPAQFERTGKHRVPEGQATGRDPPKGDHRRRRTDSNNQVRRTGSIPSAAKTTKVTPTTAAAAAATDGEPSNLPGFRRHETDLVDQYAERLKRVEEERRRRRRRRSSEERREQRKRSRSQTDAGAAAATAAAISPTPLPTPPQSGTEAPRPVRRTSRRGQRPPRVIQQRPMTSQVEGPARRDPPPSAQSPSPRKSSLRQPGLRLAIPKQVSWDLPNLNIDRRRQRSDSIGREDRLREFSYLAVAKEERNRLIRRRPGFLDLFRNLRAGNDDKRDRELPRDRDQERERERDRDHGEDRREHKERGRRESDSHRRRRQEQREQEPKRRPSPKRRYR